MQDEVRPHVSTLLYIVQVISRSRPMISNRTIGGHSCQLESLRR
jgi:hypothetical protein